MKGEHKGSGSKATSSVVSRCLKGKRRDAMDEIEAWISDTKIEFGRGEDVRKDFPMLIFD